MSLPDNKVWFVSSNIWTKLANIFSQNQTMDDQVWLMSGHDIIFEKIMLMVGHSSLDSLDSCRQVCKTWNTKIMDKIWERPTKKWGTIIQRRIETERSWGEDSLRFNLDFFPSNEKILKSKLLGKTDSNYYLPKFSTLETRGIISMDVFESLTERVFYMMHRDCLPAVTFAASLAHHGLLGSMHYLILRDDLTSVPAEHLASLVSCVRVTGLGSVDIQSLSCIDLVTILDSVKSERLKIKIQSLGREETQALVRAMESGVERVDLNEEVTLDIEALTEYSGQGTCKVVLVNYDTATRYRSRLTTWATKINWTTRVLGRGIFLRFTQGPGRILGYLHLTDERILI